MAMSRHIPGDSFLRKPMSASELNSFQAGQLQMDDTYSLQCGTAVDRVVQFLQKDVPMTVEKTIKGGSLGKGTAVRGSSDLDAVVFLSDFHNMTDFKGKIRRVIENINKHLEKYWRRGELEIEGSTQYAAKFKLKIHDIWISVDLLPAYDNIAKTGKRQMYHEMQGQWQPYSSSLVELQVDFVRTRPAAVKNLIRLVKHWRKNCIPETTAADCGRRLPSSYPLELITIGLWEQQGSPASFDLRRGFKAVLKQIKDYQNMKFMWTTNYSSTNLHKMMGKPFLLDPANPYNNVADSCNVWHEMAEHADAALQQPLLQNIYGSQWQ